MPANSSMCNPSMSLEARSVNCCGGTPSKSKKLHTYITHMSKDGGGGEQDQCVLQWSTHISNPLFSTPTWLPYSFTAFSKQSVIAQLTLKLPHWMESDSTCSCTSLNTLQSEKLEKWDRYTSDLCSIQSFVRCINFQRHDEIRFVSHTQ